MSESSIFVHPLVVMSMADHSTRELVQNKTSSVCGVLLGQSSNRAVSVLESFEIKFPWNKDTGELDMKIKPIEDDLKLYREVFPDCEVLGWYATRNQMLPCFAEVHQQMNRFTDKPLFILLNPEVSAESKDLPMDVYELTNQTGSEEFVKVPFKVESDESERVTLDYCAKVVQETKDGDVSAVDTPFGNMSKAIDSLNERIKVISLYLEDVKSGRVESNQALLREIRGLCNRLPAVDSDAFRTDYMQELNDAMLLTYLATLTKATATSRSVVQNFNTAYAGQGPRMEAERQMGGMGMFSNFF